MSEKETMTALGIFFGFMQEICDAIYCGSRHLALISRTDLVVVQSTASVGDSRKLAIGISRSALRCHGGK